MHSQKKKVKIVSTYMYIPYIDTAKNIFKNAKIVVDKFHIVQLIKNNLNSIRVELMKRKWSVCKKVCKIVSPSMVKLLS
ncbi:transposase [Peptostreptococcus anaerobius]|uniref:transposase n=3 Tax=Peptostreptococcus anaerobius TaxID=1261 RepID=UPI001D064FD1|nr:transposase [Peptostreptococcus anaerobius]